MFVITLSTNNINCCSTTDESSRNNSTNIFAFALRVPTDDIFLLLLLESKEIMR